MEQQQEQLNEYKSFINKLIQLPVWIKEAIYIELGKDLENLLTDVSLNILRQHQRVYQFYKPKITFLGEKELKSRSKRLSEQSYIFLECALKKYNIIEITLDNYWTLEETSLLLLELINQEFVEKPQDPIFYTHAMYFCGKIRLGEYLVKVNKITVDELNEALRKQKSIQETTDDIVKMGDILLDMRLITDEDIKSLLFIKQESSQRRILNVSSNIVNTSNDKEKLSQAQDKLKQLTDENKLLKAHLRKILNIKQNKPE